ncbi:hypothetical protein FB451DRAFT_1559664, partial [Mycena latifolia]
MMSIPPRPRVRLKSKSRRAPTPAGKNMNTTRMTWTSWTTKATRRRKTTTMPRLGQQHDSNSLLQATLYFHYSLLCANLKSYHGDCHEMITGC